MKRIVFCLVLIASVASASVFAQAAPKRPKITGIDHVDFYTTNTYATTQLYTFVLGLSMANPAEAGQTRRFVIGSQWVGYSPARDLTSTDRMDHVAFRTGNCSALRSYLAASEVKIPGDCLKIKDGSRSFMVKDPEGHSVEFIELSKSASKAANYKAGDAVSRRLIHVGFIVRNREAEDHFYKDILGFHIYWHGGMQPDQTDWVAMQVPDGTDWLEYMLNVKPDPDQHLMGVMNHISLGVRDMKAAQAKLESHGWKPHGDERAQMGKDGKWQLNLFDPDQTRIELMEFTPAEKPCCSEFQGPHPSETQ